MRYILFIPLFCVLLACQPDKKNEQPIMKEKFEVQKGTNIAHWLSQSGARGAKRAQFFTEADVQAIADMVFDHIRLPIDEEQMWDEQGNPPHSSSFATRTLYH